MSTVRKTVSMDDRVFEEAQLKMDKLGYSEFSDYIQALIRADTGFQPLRERAPEYKGGKAEGDSKPPPDPISSSPADAHLDKHAKELSKEGGATSYSKRKRKRKSSPESQ